MLAIFPPFFKISAVLTLFSQKTSLLNLNKLKGSHSEMVFVEGV